MALQVVEVFLLNDDDQYLEIELSPYGSYLVIPLDGYRNKVLEELPVPVEVNNFSKEKVTHNITKYIFFRIFNTTLLA